jgi:AcrR family transcriptional regulator
MDSGFPIHSEAADDDDARWSAKRREIVRCAAEVFFERGFHRGTTKEIAERAGLTQPAIYHYVGSKDDLLSEIARQVDRDFSAALETSLAVSDDPVVQLRAIIASFVDMMVVNNTAYGVYWTEQTAIQPEVKRETDVDQRRYVHRIEEVVAGVQKRGLLPPQRSTHLIAEAIIGMMSWLYWWYVPGGHHQPADISDALCELIGLTR